MVTFMWAGHKSKLDCVEFEVIGKTKEILFLLFAQIKRSIHNFHYSMVSWVVNWTNNAEIVSWSHPQKSHCYTLTALNDHSSLAVIRSNGKNCGNWVGH